MKFVKTEQAFWDYVNNFLIKYDKRYEIKEGNSYLQAIYDKKEEGKQTGVYYRRKLTDAEMQNLWIFSATKKQVGNWLKSNRLEILSELYPSVRKNIGLYNSLPEYGKFMFTDMNHAYWRMAYNMGYIKKKLYEKLIDEELPKEKQKEYKLLRNKALACLRSPVKIFDYQGSSQIRKYYDGSGELEQLYNDIRNRCYKIIYDISHEIPDGFIKYKTDGIYYMPEHQKRVEEVMQQNSMPFKTFMCKKIDGQYFSENFEKIKKI